MSVTDFERALAHLGDISPAYRQLRGYGHTETYKSLDFVRLETERLADQVLAAA